MRLSHFLLTVVFWASLSSLLAQDMKSQLDDNDILALGKSCQEYVLASDKGADTLLDFSRKIAERVKQRVIDVGADRDTAYRDMAVDWMSDNRRALENRDLKAILLVCWWFNKLVGSGIGLPAVVRENVSKEDAKEFVRFLDEQTRRKRDAEASKAPRHGKAGGAAP